MSSVLLNAVIDGDASRAEQTVRSFQNEWTISRAINQSKLKFVHFREVDDLMAVASGNNRFVLIVVAVSGLEFSSLVALKEFELQSSIVRLLNEDTIVDESPPFLCKTIRFPLLGPVLNALFDSVQGAQHPSPIITSTAQCNSEIRLSPIVSTSPMAPSRWVMGSFCPVTNSGPPSSPSMSPLIRSMSSLPETVSGFQKRKAVGTPVKRTSKSRQTKSILRTAEVPLSPKEKECTQGPKLWQDIYAPGKLVLIFHRQSNTLTLHSADATTSQNLELSSHGITSGKSFLDFYGPGSSQHTIQKLMDSIAAGVSTTFYLNLYTAVSKSALSAHITTSILCPNRASFPTDDIVTVVMTLRSASVVGNAKLIGFNLTAAMGRTSALRDNIVNAFGMN